VEGSTQDAACALGSCPARWLHGHGPQAAPSGCQVPCRMCMPSMCPHPDLTPCMQARGSDLRVHFKNTREAAFAIKGRDLNDAKKYLEQVLERQRCIPFRRYQGGVGRTAQAKNEDNPCGQGRWPVKSCEFLLGLLRNAESNAEVCARRRAEEHGRRRGGRGREGRGRAARGGRREGWSSALV
jgi:hypothetical protein